MVKLIVIGLLVAIMGALAILIKQKAQQTSAEPEQAPADGEPPPFFKKDYLLSKAERSFYEVLCGAVGTEVVIFTKVRLLDLVYLPKGTAKSQSHRNRVQSKHVDFVLCTRAAVSPILVIELDDSTHEQEERRVRDGYVDRVLAAAKLPILHCKARHAYVQTALAKEIPVACAETASG